jgi:3,5-epimerase/4-reductase
MTAKKAPKKTVAAKTTTTKTTTAKSTKAKTTPEKVKVLVVGQHGWIGGQMTAILDADPDVEWVGATSRPNDKAAFEKELEEVKPTHVMSFIGRTHGTTADGKKWTTIDYLEQKGKIYENVRDNLFSPMVMAMYAKKYNFHLTYLGTGCIFKYDETHPLGNEETGFTEASQPNFFGSGYSVVKGFTDEMMHMLDEVLDVPVLNLRIRMPIVGQHNARNFITKICHYEYICSMPNAMTVLEECLPAALKMARQGVRGTVNLTNPGLVSHNEILEMYKEIVDPEFSWKNFSPEEQLKILAADRSNNCLDTTRLSSLCPEVSPIKEAVRKSLVSIKQNVDNGSAPAPKKQRLN